MRQDMWVPYKRAEYFLDEWSSWMTWPESSEKPCHLLHGNTGTGKSTLVQKFVDTFPRSRINVGKDAEYIPILQVNVKADPAPRALYDAILMAFGGAPYSGTLLNELEHLVKDKIEKTGVKCIAFDEIHHLFHVKAGTGRPMLNTIDRIKLLNENLKISILLIGTQEALNVIGSAPELRRRFPPKVLDRWYDAKDIEYRQFLTDLESILVLREPSRLSTTRFSEYLFEHDQGLRHNIIDLIRRSTIYALKHNVEKLTPELVEQCIEYHQWEAPAQIDAFSEYNSV
jgi:Cdc6-like AAA superfamily ATPase